MIPTREKKDGIAIVLAWPATYCKQASSWYDPLMKLLGFNQNGYYQAGHAAIILVNMDDGVCQYFDFGRYHSAFAQGRVRSDATDPELKIHTVAKFERGVLTNYSKILDELIHRKACHGTGDLHASKTEIYYNKAYEKAKRLRQLSPLQYGPFIPGGTNCSRFVRTVLRAGNPNFWIRLKLLFPYTITPSPITNVRALKKGVIVQAKRENNEPMILIDLDQVLPKPILSNQVPKEAVWMAGEGAGSWFYIRQVDQLYMVTRYSPDGTIEFESCYGIFGTSKEPDLTRHFRVMPGSHYLRIVLNQGASTHILKKQKI